MTGADDLAGWLRATLDRVERVARAAVHSPGSRWEVDGEGGLLHTGTGGNGYFATGPWNTGIADEEIAHMVFWQPARVLRLVESTRRALDEHPHYEVPGGIGCGTCAINPREATVEPDGWCRTVRLLAVPFDDQPGYQAAWKP